jgi:hypothetical protein
VLHVDFQGLGDKPEREQYPPVRDNGFGSFGVDEVPFAVELDVRKTLAEGIYMMIDIRYCQQYLCDVIDLGCRLFFFVAYVPVREGPESLVLDSAQRARLASPLLAAIRDNHERLTETSGGCALWSQREWVRSLLAGSNDTDIAGQGEPHGHNRNLL